MSTPTGSDEAADTPTTTAPAPQIQAAVARFVAQLRSLPAVGETALYLVGSPALGDFSPRQSNVDLVAVTERPLSGQALRDISRAHRSMRLNGREPVVCYTTFDGLQMASGDPGASVFEGSRAVGADRLANPVTWAILARSPVALHGRPRPAVAAGADLVRACFAAQLPAIAERAGSLLWRRHLTRMVLQATRAGHGAVTGEVVSLHHAAQLALPEASHTSHRVLTDALGYREGANTSMYWGPFERKANAATLTRDLLRHV